MKLHIALLVATLLCSYCDAHKSRALLSSRTGSGGCNLGGKNCLASLGGQSWTKNGQCVAYVKTKKATAAGFTTGSCGAYCSSRGLACVAAAADKGGKCVVHSVVNCNKAYSTQICSCSPKATDCVVGGWGQWSTCSASCGGGDRSRTRSLTQPTNGGKKCPSSTSTQKCNTAACPVDCVVGDWNEWGTCSATCGGGHRTRTRALTQPINGGQACPSDGSEQEGCNTAGCPVDCVVGTWAGWGACSATCGGGEQSRSRPMTAASNGGQACPAEGSEDRQCNTVDCPVDCVVGDWASWGTCSSTCGGGVQTRTRPMTQPLNGGEACPTDGSEQQGCNTQACSTNLCTNGIAPSQASGWYFGLGGQSCTEACSARGLTCTNEGLNAHNAEVSDSQETATLIESICGASPDTHCELTYGAAAAVPSFEPGLCYASSASRALSTFNCDAAPNAIRKQRLCYCQGAQTSVATNSLGLPSYCPETTTSDALRCKYEQGNCEIYYFNPGHAKHLQPKTDSCCGPLCLCQAAPSNGLPVSSRPGCCRDSLYQDISRLGCCRDPCVSGCPTWWPRQMGVTCPSGN